MRANRTQEIWVGVFVALGVAALFALALSVSNYSSYSKGGQYKLIAYFDNIGGLKERAPVTLSGVTIGRVTSIGYDPEQYRAKVELGIDHSYQVLSEDTQASIYTAGLLGEQYVALEVGAEDAILKDGDRIVHTQSAMVLEELIGQVMVKLTSK